MILFLIHKDNFYLIIEMRIEFLVVDPHHHLHLLDYLLLINLHLIQKYQILKEVHNDDLLAFKKGLLVKSKLLIQYCS
jgi:hypothetical protein